MEYRPEIDGLRGLAVLSVILFHAGFGVLTGGYVGVDIFFVISGYLITSIIINDIRSDSFSLAEFYERRARRILPALIAVTTTCIPIAWLLLNPTDLQGFGRSLIAVSSFSSNFLFWTETGYFAGSSELKPLIHTWSLSVEEQFYILFPLCFLILRPVGIAGINILLLVVFILSLILAQLATSHFPSANFYLLPTRAWELLAGSLLAFYMSRNARLRDLLLNQCFGLLGLVLILYSMIFFSKSTPFPSFYALIPVMGAVLIIFFAVPGTLVYQVLSQRAARGLGLISYSAYLWHQPVFAFSKHSSLEPLSVSIKFILCLVVLILAWLGWQFIEKPLRDDKRFPRRKLIRTAITGLTAIAVTGAVISVFPHFIKSYDPRVLRLDEIKSFSLGLNKQCERVLPGADVKAIFSDCKIGGPSKDDMQFAIYGDSHASALSTGLGTRAKSLGITGLNLSAPTCFPSLGSGYKIPKTERQNYCLKIRENIRKLLQQGQLPSVIFLSARWATVFERTRFDNKEGGVEEGAEIYFFNQFTEELGYHEAIYFELKKTILEFKKYGVSPILIMQVPEVGWSPPLQLMKFHMLSDVSEPVPPSFYSTSFEVYQQRNEKARRTLNALSTDLDTPIISPSLYFCNLPEALGRCIVHIDGEPLYFDDDHLSLKGAEFLAEHLLEKLKN
jgi:peptidoglycan/LPS O-acetylase OafA/YrhL